MQLLIFFVQMDVRASRFASAAQPQNFGQRFGTADFVFEIGNCAGVVGNRRGAAAPASRFAAPTLLAQLFAEHRIDQVLNRLRFGHHPVRQSHAARISQSHHQLHAFQAAKAEFAFEMRRCAARRQFLEPARSAQLHQQLAHGLPVSALQSEAARSSFVPVALMSNGNPRGSLADWL